MDSTPTPRSGLLLVISGPSGVGKTTIAREVEKRLGGVFSVSATTRPRAPGEVDGRDYLYISREQFEAMIERGEFLEHAKVFGEHCYGTPREPVERQLARGKLVILEIDVQGGVQVRRAMPDALMVFVCPPSDEELLSRLRGRGRDSEQTIERRYGEAKREIQLASESGVYDRCIVNDGLEAAIEETCNLVRNRTERVG